MRSTNEIIKQNWILVALVVALIVFGIVSLKGDSKNVKKDYQKIEISEAASGSIIQAVPEKSINVTPGVVSTEANQYKWCVRLDGSEGHHLPHLLGLGESNNQGGFDFVTKLGSSSKDDFGRLDDGTYFIKESLLLKAGMTSYCELKSAEFGWLPKKMVLAEIDGQRAYVCQK